MYRFLSIKSYKTQRFFGKIEVNKGEKYMAKKTKTLTREEYSIIQRRKKIKLSFKAEKQFKKLSGKIDISRKEFAEFYANIRKANRKAQRLAAKVAKGDKNATTLRDVEFSLNRTADRITTREEFLRYKKAVNRVLKRDWRTTENLRQRERTNANLEEVFGSTPQVESIQDYLNNLSDADYNEFWDDNKDLKKLRWGSPEKAKKAAKFLGETSNKFEERIKRYEAKKAGISLEQMERVLDRYEQETGFPAELNEIRDILK